MLFLAFSDSHAPKFVHLITPTKADLVLMAGDLVDKGNVEAFKLVLEKIKEVDAPKIAVFGNDEFMDREEEFKRRYKEVTWLNDEKIKIKVKGKDVVIVGSRGVLLKPTTWQRKNIPNVEEMYKRRMELLRELLKEGREEGDLLIYLSHYAPTWRTCWGEDRKIWPYLGHPGMEKILIEAGVDIAIHGHVHKGRIAHVHVGKVSIYNVALPARRRVTLIRAAVQLRLV